jgi:hypothetical protein
MKMKIIKKNLLLYLNTIKYVNIKEKQKSMNKTLKKNVEFVINFLKKAFIAKLADLIVLDAKNKLILVSKNFNQMKIIKIHKNYKMILKNHKNLKTDEQIYFFLLIIFIKKKILYMYIDLLILELLFLYIIIY